MTVATRWLVHQGCRLLEPNERDAVQGDLAELGVTGAQELREVLGLLVRRQTALWKDWRPWLALLGVVAPFGIVLGHVARSWADGSAIYAFLYINNWTWAYVQSPGARHDLVDIGTRVCLSALALMGWSWTSGFILGSLSRRTLCLTATLFCLVVVGAPPWTFISARANPFNATVFSLTFYRVVYPWLVLLVLVLLPAGCAMRRSRQSTSLLPVPAILWVVAVALLTAWAARDLSLVIGGIFGWHHTVGDPRPLPLRLIPLLMMWPVAYIVASTCWRSWRGQSASA